MLDPETGRADIGMEGQVQERLWDRYHQNRRSLKLIWEISDFGDNMRIVSWHAGDC